MSERSRQSRVRCGNEKETLTNGYFFEHLLLAYTIEFIDDQKWKSYSKFNSSRYSENGKKFGCLDGLIQEAIQ